MKILDWLLALYENNNKNKIQTKWKNSDIEKHFIKWWNIDVHVEKSSKCKRSYNIYTTQDELTLNVSHLLFLFLDNKNSKTNCWKKFNNKKILTLLKL